MDISYNNSNVQNAPRNRNRKILWFNPPYGQNLKTSISKLLIKLVRKQFPKNNKYYKILNLNTLKLSYCCPTHVGNIIKRWAKKKMTTKTANITADQNQTAHWMVSVSLIVCHTRLLLQHPVTALFTMELLKGTSKHCIKTIQNLSDTVNAWKRLIYQNMCGTYKSMVLITIYHGEFTKRPHHTNVAQNIAVYFCWKKFPSLGLIQTLY